MWRRCTLTKLGLDAQLQDVESRHEGIGFSFTQNYR
jgi:hypothetical protein